MIIREWHGEGEIEGIGCCSYKRCQDNSHDNQLKKEDLNIHSQKSTENNEISKAHSPTRSPLDVNRIEGDGQTALHAAVSKGHLDMVKILLDRGANINKPDARGWTPKTLAEKDGNKSIYDLLLSYENRSKPDEHRIEFIGQEVGGSTGNCQRNYKREEGSQISHSHLNKAPTNSYSSALKPVRKRVTIYMQFQDRSESYRQLGKLIILPDSMEELFKIASKLLLTSK